MKQWWQRPHVRYWRTFIFRTLVYSAILLVLIYLYHYKNIQGGTFIYNEF
ncbi:MULTISPECIES: teichoic acid D-Ala incorporation-associated protein DltX [Enterococcus]|uniref:Teichoic acid D-Ala incorporation-associated protein DltX n=1 Tax=Candidatus Enterococcus mangumiae TaxID=2230878 RepID=A0ABZ2SXK5_9ENTE|nr:MULTISPECIES: teichoic acid D-Ala incorporation-associated protein DltX [unclassified Enterococcus]MBO0461088.1 teichoic acid D-Ala incorporation-associated protein DltX [Enterococcus sp. DIV1298c]MBO0490167.1 teichoic acid D-Ala incorporation-associated protein DltX [Enterococcus sp. DIV1094]MBO1298826.1 teichoic acid D-Ala incorporation-associated protein DltX [Enterococcus sp. DIV1271a]